jgi:hypothetical protein
MSKRANGEGSVYRVYAQKGVSGIYNHAVQGRKASAAMAEIMNGEGLPRAQANPEPSFLDLTDLSLATLTERVGK